MKPKSFEVWCAEKNEWENDPVLIDNDGNLFHLMRNQLMPLRADTHRVCKYIGIFAKGHIELKEGDIVKGWGGGEWVVKFNQKHAMYVIQRINHTQEVDFMFIDGERESLKIVGHECVPD